jgi:hypothetical protein
MKLSKKITQMKNKDELNSKAHSALIDIVRGFSIIHTENHEFYFKHFTLSEILLIEETYDFYLRSAKKAGIKTEKEIIDSAIKNGYWTIDKEEEIKSLKWMMTKLVEAEKKMNDPIQKLSLKQNVESKSKDLEKLKNEKDLLVKFSAENFAQNKKFKNLIANCFFKDKSFTEPVSEEESIIYHSELFNKMSDLNSKEIIVYSAYNPSFFELMSLHYRQPHVIFNKSGFDLTIYQKNILIYANSLLNKFKNYSIPDSILEDPIKILDYVEKEDAKKSNVSHGVEDLKIKSAARGGSLKAEDFLT